MNISNIHNLSDYIFEKEIETSQDLDRPEPPSLAQTEYQQSSERAIPKVYKEREGFDKDLKEIKKTLTGIQTHLNNINNDAPSVISDTINSLPSDDYETIRPINIILKIYCDDVVALLPELELFAEGQNEFEAVNNLKLEILDLIDDLEEFSDTDLGTAPKDWKRTLKQLVKKCR